MTMNANTIEIKKVWEGRMGTNLHIVYEGYINGKLVAFSVRKWLTQAICDAIVRGDISDEGCTEDRFARWACANAPAMFERMCKVQER